ncbi:MAG: (Fe-S)-binding protein [Alphaproteobacteria bacterium]
MMASIQKSSQKTVGLFVTCLVDMFRPEVATSAVRLLKKCGFQVVISKHQTCCGQIAFNNGDRDTAHKIARNLIYDFRHCDYIVAPSTSCADMVINHYDKLFPHAESLGHLFGYNYHHVDKDEDLPHRANIFRSQFYELSDFLYHIVNFVPDNLSSYLGHKKIIYHDSCTSLRNSKTHIAARGLLHRAGVNIIIPPDAANCCGFGGNFTTDFPNISETITDKKCHHILSTEADTLLSAELGCLLHLAGRFGRRRDDIDIFHLIEFLDGEHHEQRIPPIVLSKTHRQPIA